MRITLPWAGTALVVTLIAASAPTLANDQPSVDRVRSLLSGYEHQPGPEQLRALGPDTLQVLISLYEDRGEPTYIRLRAVSAAAHFASTPARAFLRRVAREPGQGDLFVRQAVMGLAQGFGVAALDEVSGFLRHDEPLVRRAAATCLGRMGTTESTRRLRRHLDTEHDPVVRRVVHRMLQRASSTSP
jgi:HEAT repeat protein